MKEKLAVSGWQLAVKCRRLLLPTANCQPPTIHATEEAGAVPQPARTGPAALLASHVLRDGEIVLLILKPSLWFILLNSLLFAGIVAVVAGLGFLASGRIPGRERFYVDAATILIICRLMWATLRWMGR